MPRTGQVLDRFQTEDSHGPTRFDAMLEQVVANAEADVCYLLRATSRRNAVRNQRLEQLFID
jgi:hypothetical protein